MGPPDPAATHLAASNTCVRRGGDGFATVVDAADAYDFGPDLAGLTADFLGANAPREPFADDRFAAREPLAGGALGRHLCPMCGRMVLTHAHDALARLFRAEPANDLPDVPNYNVCPTNRIAAVTSLEGRRLYRPMRWGLIPPWYKAPNGGPLLINARSETVAEKPAFRTAVRERRCLVPAAGFYEWDRIDAKTPLPFLVTREDGEPMVFAAIWQDWGEGEERMSTVAVLTCAANAQMARVHDRLPVMIEPGDWPLWLGEAGKGAARLTVPVPDGTLRMVRVGTEVNSNRAAGEGLIAPLEPVNPA